MQYFGDSITVSISGSHNKFPYYELFVDGASRYQYQCDDAGPGIKNLNASTSFKTEFSV